MKNKIVPLTEIMAMIDSLTLERENVKLPGIELALALGKDMLVSKRPPTREEVEQMFGNEWDEDKVTPFQIRMSFPETTELVESAWQFRPRR